MIVPSGGAPFALKQLGAVHSLHFTTDASDLPRQLVAEESNLLCVDLDLASVSRSSECWRAIGEGLGFPAASAGDPGYAANGNAFLDWLTDLSWIDAFQGAIVILRNSGPLWGAFPFEMGTLIETWLAGAEYWSVANIPMHLILECREGTLS